MTNLSNAWPGTDEVGDTGEMGAPLLAAAAQRPQSAAAVLKIANIVLGSNIIPYVCPARPRGGVCGRVLCFLCFNLRVHRNGRSAKKGVKIKFSAEPPTPGWRIVSVNNDLSQQPS